MTRHEQTRSSPRDAILARIDTALGPSRGNAPAEWDSLSRDYIRQDFLTGPAVVDLFEHRILDYGARVFRCNPSEIQDTIAKVLADRRATRMLIPAGIPMEWLPIGQTFTEDGNLSHARLDGFDGVLTTATAAIAATGSIVLQHGEGQGGQGGQGRRALTLIPDYHLCIVRTDQIVETVPTAFARLDPAKPTTFISGPSATADIEMTRIKGVHGPRFMDVVLVM
jgi:L-lactate dehydrogenase complex protein LldG